MKRENFDVVYGTSRFEDMIVLGEPSQQYLEEAKRIEGEQKLRLDAVRRREREVFEADQRAAQEERDRIMRERELEE